MNRLRVQSLCILKGLEISESDLLSNAENLAQRVNFGVILVSGGHFAAAIFEGLFSCILKAGQSCERFFSIVLL